MAAYAALVSVMNIIHDLQQHHSPPISIPHHQLQSLSQILTSLLEFLESSKSPLADDTDEVDPFEMRIADAAYAVEDVIESYLVNVISPTHLQQNRYVPAKISRFINCCRASDDEQTRSIKFYQDLQRVIEEMDLIEQMAVEMNTEKAVAVHTHNASVSALPLRSSSIAVVWPDAVLTGLMDKLVLGGLDRHVIPIVGMGGIGKTTLALNIYERKTIKEHFVVCAWVTVSQEYNARELLCELLAQVTYQNKEKLSDRSEDKLGTELYKYLFGRRFLIVIDDVWSIDAWEKIQPYFPNNGNGSRIMVTTRLSQLSSQLNPNNRLQMKFLDETRSWDLFSKIVFGEGTCPLELKKIGEEIVENCRGLPLSIVVVGGLLKKMARSRECWESIRDNLTSVINLENDNHCLRLLKLSYNHLPAYLKPCFLYMGMFEEDDEIRVSTIIKLWVSEGFLKPTKDRSLKTISMGFFKDLVDRNLILIEKMGSTGNINSCKIHDLLRGLCINESGKEGFYHVIGRSQGTTRQCRRIFIPKNTSKEKVIEGFKSMPYARSVICENENFPAHRNFGLLRTFHAYKYPTFIDRSFMNSNVFQYVNTRHLAVQVRSRSSFFSSLHLFWNLHTLIVSRPYYYRSSNILHTLTNLCHYEHDPTVPVEVWKMRQLRHIEFLQNPVCLPDPPPIDKDEDVVIMENLQVLKGVKNFKCSEEIVKRIPNLKKLRTLYLKPKGSSNLYDDHYCASNFQFLSKLEDLFIYCDWKSRDAPHLQKITFPQSLKKLTLWMNNVFEWEDILKRIGSLPHLEKLTLYGGRIESGKWEMVEGQFPELKYLRLVQVNGLKQWIVEDSSMLPRLEQLILSAAEELQEFPIEIGNITTLQKVFITVCSEAVVRSVRVMVDEQVDIQGDQLPFLVQILLRYKNEALQSLSTPNFTVSYLHV